MNNNQSIISKKKIRGSVKIGKNSVIKAEEVYIDDNVVIGDNVTISAQKVLIGYGTKIESNVMIALNGEQSIFEVGDHFYLGENSKIVNSGFKAGDYVTIHSYNLTYGKKSIVLGHNIWIGNNSILNSQEFLKIGNGVGIGTYNSIWTHGFFGELIEGCTMYSVKPTIIEDDVWLLGSFNVVSPGVKLGKRSTIMTGSVVTNNVPEFGCVSGNPAKDISDKLTPYKNVTINEKYQMMKEFIEDFVKENYCNNFVEIENGWKITDNGKKVKLLFYDNLTAENISSTKEAVIFTKKNSIRGNIEGITIFDLSSKKYTKNRARVEIKIIKYLLNSKARFIPYKFNDTKN